MKTYKIEDFQNPIEYHFEEPKKKNNFKHYFFKYSLCFILGFLLSCVGIDFFEWKFYVVIVPMAIFDTFRDEYFKI